MLPYDRFVFWRKLLKCKTWGDIRAMCNDDWIEMMKDRYKRRWDPWEELEEDDEKHINNLKDDTVIDFGEEGDFDLCDHLDLDTTFCEKFPPPIERLMYEEIIEDETIFDPYSNVHIDCYCIAYAEQEAVFDDLEKRERVAIYCPQMRDMFVSFWDF